MIGIIDYGLGNLGSIQNMLKVIGVKSVISSDINILEKCDKYILPGVGAFDAGMSQLTEKGLVNFIKKIRKYKFKNTSYGMGCCGFQKK